VSIRQLLELPASFEGLAAASEREGYEFLRRLEREWHSSENRFERPGERLLCAEAGGKFVAVGGLNRDHYLDDPRVGRVRHVYVLPERRNVGVGALIVRALLDAGRESFDNIRVRAATTRSDTFYARLGFKKVEGEPGATHVLLSSGILGAACGVPSVG
jgi:N-acetylglutamate synthase-like GNAT family acetyltransferase